MDSFTVGTAFEVKIAAADLSQGAPSNDKHATSGEAPCPRQQPPAYVTRGMTSEERMVIFASSLGTVFEWYDFYIYGTLAPILAAQFFSGVNPTAAFIFTLLAFAAGFAVRPFGALFFGRLGDLIGRKYTFLITMILMGVGTFFIGVLPSYASAGIIAPVILICLRLAQGLALGGEYGGAATYVAEHAPKGKRGYYTSWIQTTATVGLFMALLLVLGIRTTQGEPTFAAWGWRIPFLLSAILLAVSIWIRLKLQESPLFQRMKDEGKASKRPLSEAFGEWGNAKIAIFALLGATAGEAVVWYGGQFYALFFLTQTLKVPAVTAQIMIAISLLLGTPFFILFGWLSDKIGRKPIILAGFALGVVTYFPIFQGTDPLRQSEAGSGARRRAGDRHRRPERMLVPVQSGRHRQIHHVVRHRQVGAGRAFGELRERGGAAGHQSQREGRRQTISDRHAGLRQATR